MTSKTNFESLYSNINRFTDEYGWIEIGVSDSYNDNSFIKAFDEGGTVWIGEENYPSMEKALQDLEQALENWFAGVIGEK